MYKTVKANKQAVYKTATACLLALTVLYMRDGGAARRDHDHCLLAQSALPLSRDFDIYKAVKAATVLSQGHESGLDCLISCPQSWR